MYAVAYDNNVIYGLIIQFKNNEVMFMRIYVYDFQHVLVRLVMPQWCLVIEMFRYIQYMDICGK